MSLFIDGEELLSCEGTTQGDLLTMAMFAVATVPLIKELRNIHTKQIWYADDASSSGSLENVRRWWDLLTALGPGYGYFPNPSKTVLLTKEEFLFAATETFAGTCVSISTQGKLALGCPISIDSFVSNFILSKISEWSTQLLKLSEIAITQCHTAFNAFT